MQPERLIASDGSLMKGPSVPVSCSMGRELADLGVRLSDWHLHSGVTAQIRRFQSQKQRLLADQLEQRLPS
jgi:hypothetical protein